MEAIANKIANKIAVELHLDNDKRAVVNYGLIAMVQMIVLVGIALIIGFIFGVPIEVLIACFSVSTLRKYTGGAHANSIEFCTLTGIVVSTITAVISGNILPNIINRYHLVILMICIYAFAFCMCYKKAPIDSINKPIKSEEKRARMKKKALSSLAICCGISIIFLVLGSKFDIFIGLNLSLVFGVLWQIFTMTIIAGKILGQIEKYINIVIFREGGKE